MQDVLQEKFKEALKIYKANAFDKKDIPTLCRIHDAFGDSDGKHHNCLGCNFADSQVLIYNYLKKYKSYKNIRESITLYILTLYLLVERMDTVMNLVQVPNAYREKHFKVFQQVRKWANFIKHPKAFILTHHPEYDFENSGIDFGKTFVITIDDSFVTNYYKGESDRAKQENKNEELYKKLHNQKDIRVVFPDIAVLTKKLCFAINSFSDLILNNQVYRDYLNDETTISNYFKEEDNG